MGLCTIIRVPGPWFDGLTTNERSNGTVRPELVEGQVLNATLLVQRPVTANRALAMVTLWINWLKHLYGR
jgi:hypothetical protein